MASKNRVSQTAGRIVPPPLRRRRGSAGGASDQLGPPEPDSIVDLKRRRDELNARVAELQFDLGGLVYEMAVRDRIRVEVLVRHAAVLQSADAELGEVERILRLEETSTAGQCGSCAAPHSSGAAYCWQCGQPLLQEVHTDQIAAPAPAIELSTQPTTELPQQPASELRADLRG
jgi:hypothetical protein